MVITQPPLLKTLKYYVTVSIYVAGLGPEVRAHVEKIVCTNMTPQK